MASESVTVLMVTVEGRAPNGDLVGTAMTAMVGTPPEALEQAVELGFMKLKADHPGVEDLRVLTPWRAVELPVPDEDEDDEA